MKIHPNTHTGPPLQDAIDAFAEAYETMRRTEPSQLWRVRLHLASVMDVSEQSLHEKDVRYFIRRMGAEYLARRVRGVGDVVANRLVLWSEGFDR